MPHLESGDYCFVAHDYLTGDGGNSVHHDCTRRFQESDDPFVNLYRKGYVASSSVVARRETVLAAGGYDPTLPNAQDFDLWLAMTRSPDTRFLVFGEALLHYHPSPGGIMSHTKRRLDCCLIIARRYIPDLKRRNGSALASLWFRVMAIHLEAIRAYGHSGNLPRMLLIAGKLPFALLSVTLFYFFQSHGNRETYRAEGGSPTMGEIVGRQPLLNGILWLWVAGAMTAYIYQFRNFAGPLLDLLGLG